MYDIQVYYRSANRLKMWKMKCSSIELLLSLADKIYQGSPHCVAVQVFDSFGVLQYALERSH